MTNHNTNASNDLAQPPSRRRRKGTVVWTIAAIVAGLFLAGAWFWSARPAQVQAAISDTRSTTSRTDVMTVEAISEGGASLVGRSISIVGARVAQVSGTGRFWVAGSEGEPLFVVMDRPQDAAAELTIAIGERVSVAGVLRQGTRSDAAAPEGQAYVSKEPLHLAATTVRQADR